MSDNNKKTKFLDENLSVCNTDFNELKDVLQLKM